MSRLIPARPRLGAAEASASAVSGLSTVGSVPVSAPAPNPDRGGGQRPLPSPLRIEDELPLVSAARLRGLDLRAEGGEGGRAGSEARAGPGLAGACFAPAGGHWAGQEVGRG